MTAVVVSDILVYIPFHLGLDVFNQNTIVLASGASSNATGNFYLGRPWAGISILTLMKIF
jgi:hypothetical protein